MDNHDTPLMFACPECEDRVTPSKVRTVGKRFLCAECALRAQLANVVAQLSHVVADAEKQRTAALRDARMVREMLELALHARRAGRVEVTDEYLVTEENRMRKIIDVLTPPVNYAD